MLKIISNLCLVIFLTPNLWGQADFKVTAKSRELDLSKEYDGKLNVNITNNADVSFILPFETALVNKEFAGINELGMEVRNATKKFGCRPSLDYIINPSRPYVKINPGETKSIQILFFGECFKRKGKYKIKFFLNRIITNDNIESHKTYSSNRLLIRIR